MIIKNFLFHRVSDENDVLWPPMKPALFDRIIKKLTSEFEVVNLEEYLLKPQPVNRRGKSLATVLFDDGYKDNIEYAAPILKKHNCPASFYIVTDCIDRNIPTWTYILDDTLQKTPKLVIELDYGFVPDLFKKILPGGNMNTSTKKLKPWMKSLSNSQRLQIMKSITEQAEVQIPGQQMMNWGEVKQLSDNGFTIGSHTDTHPMLARLEDNQELVDELKVSYDKIVHRLDKAPATISYPIGSYDKKVMVTSESLGYKFGLAVDQRFYDTKTDNLFSIPRVELYQEPWYKVNARISGIYSRIKRLWK